MKPYQVEVEKNGCERCGEGKMWVIVRNGIAGGTSYASEDEAVELCDELNIAFEAGRADSVEIKRLGDELQKSNRDWLRLKDYIIAGEGPNEMFRLQDSAKSHKGVEVFMRYIDSLWNELARRKP